MTRQAYLCALAALVATTLCFSGCNPRVDAIRVSTDTLNIGLTEAPQTFEVWNTKPVMPSVDLDVVPTESWVVPDATQISCPPPESASGPYVRRRLTVTIDRSGLAPGTHTAAIELRGAKK